jgi:hypothetical protein
LRQEEYEFVFRGIHWRRISLELAFEPTREKFVMLSGYFGFLSMLA